MNEDGQTSTIRDKILTIDVQPGWKQGTRITFEKEGDQVTTLAEALCGLPVAAGGRQRGERGDPASPRSETR